MSGNCEQCGETICACAERQSRLNVGLGMGDMMTLNFGKYKGKDIREVMEIDPSYIAWAASVGAIMVGKQTLKNAQEAHDYERFYAEAVFESEHSDWGDRD